MPARSAIARLQAVYVLAVVAAALVLLLWVWPRAPMAAVLIALGVVFHHAILLGIECVLMRVASRHDAVAPARAPALVLAWWREVLHATRVFGWRQPFAWRRVPDDWCGGQPELRGIVFVHGFMCNRGFWTPWLEEAQRRGHAFAAVNLEPVFAPIDDGADTVDAAVRRLHEATGREPVLVCHSMGGLVARAWMRKHDGARRIAHVVTIGSPHAGTWLARFSRVANGRQMRRDGEWLAALAREGPAEHHQFTCWYADADNIVFPPSTAMLPGAHNRLVSGAAHVDLAFRPQVMRETFEHIQRL
jgi:pimeloyl-ACP methyl ester carboxylesterase